MGLSVFGARRVEDPVKLRLSHLFYIKWKETLVVGRVTQNILRLSGTPFLVASYLHGPSWLPDHTAFSGAICRKASRSSWLFQISGGLLLHLWVVCVCLPAHSGTLFLWLIDSFGHDLSQFLFPGFLPAEEMIVGSHPSALVAREERISLSYGPGPTAHTPVLQRLILFWLLSLPNTETFLLPSSGSHQVGCVIRRRWCRVLGWPGML